MCVLLQEEDAVSATVDSVMWASPNKILVCLNSGPDADTAYMAMLTWEAWDTDALDASPSGLSVQKAGFFTDVQQAMPQLPPPHMKGVIVPKWDITILVHRNVSDYHVKVIGKHQYRPATSPWVHSYQSVC